MWGIRATIKQSVTLEHRTKEDWEKFRGVQKSMGLTLPVTDSTMPDFEEVAVDNMVTDEVATEKSEDTRSRQRNEDAKRTALLLSHSYPMTRSG